MRADVIDRDANTTLAKVTTPHGVVYHVTRGEVTDILYGVSLNEARDRAGLPWKKAK